MEVPSEKDDPGGSDRALRDWGVKLHQCVRYWQHVNPSIQKWWLITDDLGKGRNLTLFANEVAARWEQQDDFCRVEIFMEDGWPAGREPTNQAQTILSKVLGRSHDTGLGHSAGPSATGPMGHEDMAKSLLDWMDLHESKITMLTAGSFGASGANGNGKFKGGSPLSEAVTAEFGEATKTCSLATWQH